MNVVKILEGRGRIQLVELASLLLPDPVNRSEEEEFGSGGCQEDCEECEGDQEEWMRCRLRNAIALFEVD